ncbi:MAG: class I SAM-dependent methyltransferase [archaeon]
MNKKITPEEEHEDPNSFYTREEAERYDQSSGMRKTQEELTSILLALLDTEPNKEDKILDIGCGTGFSLTYLKSLGYESLVGIDVAHEMINIAKKKNLDVFVGGFLDLNKLSLEKNNFNLIISVSALQWVISNKEEMEIKNIIKKIGKNVFSLLSENGVCVIQFYPKDEKTFEIVTSAFERCNFYVNKFIYNEKSIKKRKFILVLNK